MLNPIQLSINIVLYFRDPMLKIIIIKTFILQILLMLPLIWPVFVVLLLMDNLVAVSLVKPTLNKHTYNHFWMIKSICCLLYTSDAADEEDSVDLGGRR